jgi:hypothetical protein
VVAVFVASACRIDAAEAGKKASVPKASPSTLAQMAMESELAGKSEKQAALLREAIEQSPDDASARWQSKQIFEDGIWMTLDDVQKKACKDERLAQYDRMRDAAGETVEGQAALARWCRKNKLADQERVHWMRVLAIQPNNTEAIQALDLRVYQGMLLTPAQIEQFKAMMGDMRQAVSRWSPIVKKWRKALENKDESRRQEIVAEVRSIREPAELLALDYVIRRNIGAKTADRQAYEQVSGDMVGALKDMSGPPAAESLARYAVFSPFESVRTAACDALKQRPLDHYAPLMLSWLSSLIETNFVVVRDVDGNPAMQQTFFREGPFFNVSHTILRTTSGTMLDPIFMGLDKKPDVREQYNAARATGKEISAGFERGFVAQAASRQNGVEKLNRAITEQNRLVDRALSRCTDVEVKQEPMQWWDWWLQYNDWQDLGKENGKKRTYETIDSSNSISSMTPHSCFAGGTKVWTLTGLRCIEQIKPGDRVLSQDVDTGELQYKPVLMGTVNPMGRIMKIDLDKETVSCTPGHPMWSVGGGWRLARQLEPGERLHALSGCMEVQKVEKAETEEGPREYAYNLIVADFGTYFVGKQGILVHDNSPRKPTSAVLPGLVNAPKSASSEMK